MIDLKRLVFKFFTIDRFTAGTITRSEISALYHEPTRVELHFQLSGLKKYPLMTR